MLRASSSSGVASRPGAASRFASRPAAMQFAKQMQVRRFIYAACWDAAERRRKKQKAQHLRFCAAAFFLTPFALVSHTHTLVPTLSCVLQANRRGAFTGEL